MRAAIISLTVTLAAWLAVPVHAVEVYLWRPCGWAPGRGFIAVEL
jgi:hypothetical protein